MWKYKGKGIDWRDELFSDLKIRFEIYKYFDNEKVKICQDREMFYIIFTSVSIEILKTRLTVVCISIANS